MDTQSKVRKQRIPVRGLKLDQGCDVGGYVVYGQKTTNPREGIETYREPRRQRKFRKVRKQRIPVRGLKPSQNAATTSSSL